MSFTTSTASPALQVVPASASDLDPKDVVADLDDKVSGKELEYGIFGVPWHCWLGGFEYFLFSPLFGEDSHFD